MAAGRNGARESFGRVEGLEGMAEEGRSGQKSRVLVSGHFGDVGLGMLKGRAS